MPLPARLSVYDEGYDPRNYPPLAVLLDGVEQRDVTAYDVEAGTVSRLQRDDAGNLVHVDPELFGVIEKVRGTVQVFAKFVL